MGLRKGLSPPNGARGFVNQASSVLNGCSDFQKSAYPKRVNIASRYEVALHATLEPWYASQQTDGSDQALPQMDKIAYPMKSKFTAIDLFSGCGGLSQGLKGAGFDVLAAAELDPRAISTYRLNHPETEILTGDIKGQNPLELRNKLGMARGQLGLLAGCPPCQGFSALRTRNGSKQNRDSRNGLVREMLRFAIEFMPRSIMVENVPGLQGKQALEDFMAGIAELGYKSRFSIKNARFFGVPQRRRRLILVAGLGFDVDFAAEDQRLHTVRETIGHLPRAGNSGDPIHDLPEKRSVKIAQLIQRIPKNGGSRSSLTKDLQLPCHQRCHGFYDVYGRMSWDTASPTITSGCFNPSKGRFLHPEEDRCITMREAALLQSFPPDYKFDVGAGKQAIALMIGNALPPEFIRRHAESINSAIRAQETPIT